MDVSIHEIANYFPKMLTIEYEALRDSIKENGQIEPIWVYEGKIIDGRHRYKACCELGIEPKFQEWDGKGSLKEFVIALNINRRHLTSSQRAVIALAILPDLEEKAKERIESQNYGRSQLGQKIDQVTGKSTQLAAEMFDTNREYVSKAKTIMEKDPFMLEDVRDGKLTIPQAMNELDKRNRNEIDETHPITPDQAYGEIGFAVLCDALRLAANKDAESKEWLMDEYGGCFYCQALGVNYNTIIDWVDGGCDNRPVTEIIIGIMRNQFEAHNRLAQDNEKS